MSTNENIGEVGVYKLECFVIISARIASDMHHQDFFSFTFKYLCVRDMASDFLVVTVSVDTDKGFEFFYFQKCLFIAEISCMPDLVYRGKELLYSFVKVAMCVRDNTYIHIVQR